MKASSSCLQNLYSLRAFSMPSYTTVPRIFETSDRIAVEVVMT